MGAEVQSKTYFPSSLTDVNNGLHNGVWDLLYHDDKNHKISAPQNSQHFDYFLTTQPVGGLHAKEQIKQTILKHESIFKHQIQELHRLYKRQKDLMNPVPVGTSNFGQFLSQLSTNVPKETRILGSSFSRFDSIKGKCSAKNGIFERRVIDLESPADVDENNEKKSFNLADLNEPIQVEENGTAFSTIFSNKSQTESSANRTLFGVEMVEKNHTPTFNFSNHQPGAITRDTSCFLPWRATNSVHHNHWINSSDSKMQKPGLFAGNSSFVTNSTDQNSFSGICFQNGKDLVPDNIKKNRFVDMWKNHETTEQTLPHWLTSKPCLQNEQIKTKIHHINMDSLQNHSQLFFKKTETGNEFKKVKIDNTKSITKILGVPIIANIDQKVETFSESNEKKHQIDLNLCLEEEEEEEDTTPSFPESVVKIATMEIDLEAPAVLESDPDRSTDTHLDLVKLAAEAIVSISNCKKPSSETLMWFADVITSNDLNQNNEIVPEVEDYFEYMTLNLEETEEKYEVYKPTEEDNGMLSKRPIRKGQGKRGRQKRDFQKDILPSIVSLSRREVSEDIQIFEQVFCATGVSWQSSLSKRKAARGRRRLVEPVAAAAGGGDRSVCRGMLLDKSLGGWGRRTRRLPRQRCQNGGNNHHSLALKC